MKNLKEYILNENNFFKNLGIGYEVQIRKWCDEHNLNYYDIRFDEKNDRPVIHIKGKRNVYLYIKEEFVPDYIKFDNINGSFDISRSNVKTLKGWCPDVVKGNFKCEFCDITSLDGCPQVSKTIDCSNCGDLLTLEGCPQVVENFFCGGCFRLKNLKGAPQVVEQVFICPHETLESLEGAPKEVGKRFAMYATKKRLTKWYYDDIEKVCNVKGGRKNIWV